MAILLLAMPARADFTIIQDNFGTNVNPLAGTAPSVVNLPGGTYTKMAGWPWSTPNAVGGYCNMGENGPGLAVSMTSSGGYLKPARFRISADLRMTQSQANDTLGVGFWVPPLPAPDTHQGPVLTGFTGLRLTATDSGVGTLTLYENGAVAGAAVSTGVTIYFNTFYDLAYTVDTATGDISDVVVAGVPITDFTTTAFTDAATAYAGFFILGDQNARGNVDNFLVTSNNPTLPPQVSVTAPATGYACGQGAQPVILTATTTNGTPAVVTGVRFFDGLTSLGAATDGGANTWNLAWDTTTAYLGAHSITAKATDGGGLSGTSLAIIVNVLLPGDSNSDGSVDGLDYNNWQNGYQQPGATFATGDYNGDGSVDGLDYNLWQNNYSFTATYVADQFSPMAAAAASAPRLVGVTATAGSLALEFDAAVEVGAGAVEISDGRALAQSYNAATRTLTVTFAASDAPYDVRVIADFVTAGGVALDGEVGDPADPTLPSGDGVAGGDAQLEFTAE